jgi:hypothetical protein
LLKYVALSRLRFRAGFSRRQATGTSFAQQVEQAVARRTATFKQADLVRAVKAARAAGLSVTATQITPDGTIKLVHTEGAMRISSDYDRFEADL